MRRATIVAEAGVNHEASLATCLEMVDRAAEAGVDVFKVQVYDPVKLVTESAPGYWEGATTTQRSFYKTYEGMTRDMYEQVAEHCHTVGIEFCASVFHVEDVPWLSELVDVFKIASGDITHLELLQAVRATGIPCLVSTGASDMDEISEAAGILKSETLLHCVLSYPTAVENVNLSAIEDMRWRFRGRHIGYSDHTMPEHSLGVILAAYQLGATVFEKHYTLDRRHKGNDHYHSFNPKEFAQLRQCLDSAYAAQGSGGKRVLECELPARQGARRSLTALHLIHEGEQLTRENTCLKRPGGGLPYLNGRRTVAVRDILPDETIQAGMVEVVSVVPLLTLTA